jgi:hypothetical protein
VAVLIALTLAVEGATSAATAAVVLHLHMPAHHHAQDATQQFLRHKDFTRIPAQKWQF